MAKMLCKTNGDASPAGKPRVYFTCHPEDVSVHLQRICRDLFAAHDCAVYYTEDMHTSIDSADRETDLDSCNLFVVPVTWKLLSQPNRAMDEDVPYALAQHIPVLPLMMEPGLDTVYARPDRFGELQYLNPCSKDHTEISYGEKLKKFLDSVLISDELAQRIRSAFAAYIFLSYRKKDRHLANALMRRIHAYPEYRDVAVWYDEFLTPGESFRANIDRMLAQSRLFALLVTPNLLEEPQGKPNFVMGTEFPAARDSGIPILPVEMTPTDRNALEEKYRGIPHCVKEDQEESFRQRLAVSLERAALATGTEPMHDFLIGLAYLEGIDVEVDRRRGVELITSAADRGLPEAMGKLTDLYFNGHGVPVDYQQARIWCRKFADNCEHTLGPTHIETLRVLNQLALITGKAGDNEEFLKLAQMAYDRSCAAFGETHTISLYSLNNLAVAAVQQGLLTKSLELSKKTYELRCKALGEDDVASILALDNLAQVQRALGNLQEAWELNGKAYQAFCRVCGYRHPDTLIAMDNYAQACSEVGDKARAMELTEQAYELYREVFGETHPETLAAMRNLAACYQEMGDPSRALSVLEAAYTMCSDVLGAEHPGTLHAMSGLAACYYELGDQKRALEWSEKAYGLRKKILGPEHPETLVSGNRLCMVYADLEEYEKAAEFAGQIYDARCRVLGAAHLHTLNTLSNLACCHLLNGDYQKAADLLCQECDQRRKVQKESHPAILNAMRALCDCLFRLDRAQEAVDLLEDRYILCRKEYGRSHPMSLKALNEYARVCYELDDPRGLPMLEQLYGLYFEVLEHDDPRLESVYEMLCSYYYTEIDCDEDAEEREFRYAIYRNVLGPHHPATIRALETLASYYLWDRADGVRALEMYEDLYRHHSRISGPEAKDTIWALEGMADSCQQAGFMQRARELAQRIVALHTAVHGADSDYVLDARERLEEIEEMLDDESEEG